MRLFFLQDYQHWLLSVFLGLVLAILIYLAFRSYGYARAAARGKPVVEHDYPDGLKGGNLPMPPFIILLCLAFVVWAVFYVIYVGVRGGAF